MPRMILKRQLSPCRNFWTVHVPKILEASDDTCLDELTGVAVFRVTGPGGGVWTVSANRGRIVSVVETESEHPSFRVTLTEKVFLEIALGRLDHKQAFFSGDVEIEGDTPLALRVANLIPCLRHAFPFCPSELLEGDRV